MWFIPRSCLRKASKRRRRIRYPCSEIAWIVNRLARTLSAELDEKGILITSLDDYSRMLLYADCVKAETSWAHIQACSNLYEAGHRHDYA